ncbi:MAG: intradiol ring-cleavage dioxygenase [Sphingobacteriales bacterium]|nr:MAG: intradiol ring-cleavage dioxygenase [Sphingobacteriales bacterium]
MKPLIQIGLIASLFNVLLSCNGQANEKMPIKQESASTPKIKVGGRCEDCKLINIGMPEDIASTDTSSGWQETGQKLLVSGVVFKKDGRTPADNVIIYYWQTDNNGFYSPMEGLDEQAKQHGHIRGWMKTDELGRYALYTIRPTPYPKTENPSHIHLLVKEPDIDNEYYIDDIMFDDDAFLTENFRNRLEKRGGNGIVKVGFENEMQIAKRDIILGYNIPDYPEK